MFSKKIFQWLLSATLVVFACAFVAQNAMANPPGNWQKLGEKKVDFKFDHDVLQLSVADGDFKQLKFVVRHGALNMYRCVVHFKNGNKQEIELRHNFAQGSDSRVVDLNGNERFIDKIDFWYDTKNASNKKATLVVFG